MTITEQIATQEPGPAPRRKVRKPRYLLIGVVVFGLVLAALVLSIAKPQLTTWFSPGEYRTISFAGDYFVLPDSSKVKVAGVEIGRVDSIEPGPDGTGVMRIKVDGDIPEKVGSAPSAVLRTTTLLGGIVYVDLVPGGDRTSSWEEPIPVERTRLPVGVSQVIQSVQPDATAGARSAVNQLDATMQAGGGEAVRDLLESAPDTFRPAAGVIDSVRGTRPEADLPQLVGGLQSAAAVLDRREVQLEEILTDLRGTTSAMADASPATSEAIRRLPAALGTATPGLQRLQGTLVRLRDTAGLARPGVQELSTTLERLDPLLAAARPVVSDLRASLQDLRPTASDLVPTSRTATQVLDDLEGPVLDRLNGPVAENVLTPFRGTGPYAQSGGDNPMYQELGFMLSGLAKSGSYVDGNGHAVAFQPGAGAGSVAGTGMSLEQMYQQILLGGAAG